MFGITENGLSQNLQVALEVCLDLAPRIIILAGPNGTGKLTSAPALLRDTFAVDDFVNADTIAQGLSAFNPEGVPLEAGRIMIGRLRDLSRRRTDFAFETTLSACSYAGWPADGVLGKWPGGDDSAGKTAGDA